MIRILFTDLGIENIIVATSSFILSFFQRLYFQILDYSFPLNAVQIDSVS